MVDFERNTVSLWERWTDKTMNSQNVHGKTEKFLKTILKAQTPDFCDWYESRISHQNPCDKILKKLYKCFSSLEGPPVRKSRREPWKFLSKPRNWSFHSRTNCQTKSQEIKKPRFLKNFLGLFRDWDFNLPESRENLLCKLATRGSRLAWLVR